ncbi:hypothetical protein NW801_00245 [Brevibacillus laterosporus]|uniref:DUF4227 domain-containing protein n=1 Tax=Brevibacillus halotolerans TaxID=1507437 RepID=A0ABT4HSJ1_9BACL|nr:MULTISPECIES: hypothetical protein [Brevibacillus]MCR8983503.1 hypothetical protein [Brevibacillus laterosporus]MCZ0829220.1 hypothetical protein [Brevibacillus halotolerans]
MENVELPARRIIGRVTKCAVVLAFIVWCISYDLPKRIESYEPKHVQTKQATKGFSDHTNYMYHHWLPAQTTIIL